MKNYNISHEKYLEDMIYSNKLHLREKEVQHRIAIAKYNAERELLQKQIDSMEKQLENNKE